MLINNKEWWWPQNWVVEPQYNGKLNYILVRPPYDFYKRERTTKVLYIPFTFNQLIIEIKNNLI